MTLLHKKQYYFFLVINGWIKVKKMHSVKAATVFCFALLAGCSATTKFESVQPGVRLKIDDNPDFVIVNGNPYSYKTTSFGQYRFKVEGDGYEAMHGNIPLKFNGGYLALDILFFAPAMLFNLREVYPYYRFDLEKKEVSYKSRKSDNWMIYKPTH